MFKDHIPIWITRLPQNQRDWSPCLLTVEGHSSEVMSVAFSLDGEQIVSGSWNKTVQLWGAMTGVTLQTPKSDSSLVNSGSFSSHGKCIVPGSQDKMGRLWDVTTEAELQTLKDHSSWLLSSWLTSVAFSPDGKCIVSGLSDNTVRLWDTVTGAALQTLEGCSGRATSVAFSLDGKLVLTLSASNSWITEGTNISFWLFFEYRATFISVWNKATVLGHFSGRISILRFKEGSRLV